MNENSLYETQTLVRKLGAVTRLINERNERATGSLEASARALHQNTQRLAEGGKRLAEDALATFRAQGAQVLSQGTDRALNELQQQMQQSIGQARQLEEVLMQHRRGVVGLTRMALIVLAVGALLAAGGSIYVAYDRLSAVKGAQFGQDIVQAMNDGMITRCGDSLCVHAGKTPTRYSQNPEYVLIRNK